MAEKPNKNEEKGSRYEVPIWHKTNLTVEEAAAYSGIGINKINQLSNGEDCPFVLWNGNKRLIKRRKFDDFIEMRMLRRIVALNSEREIQLPHISPHILRHTAATRLAESGCDIKVMQYILGQTDIRTTMRVYNHVDTERVKREMEKLETLQAIIG